MSTEVATIEITPLIEKTVWRRLGNTPLKKIAQETGLSREQIIQVRNDLLDGVDELTVAQKKQKLIVELEGIAHEARERANSSAADFQAGLFNSSIAAMKTMLVELNRMEKADTSKVQALNAMRVRELLNLIDVAVSRTLEDIADDNGLDRLELDAIFQKHLRPAAEELEASAS